MEPYTSGSRYRTGLALAEVPMLENFTWRNVAALLAGLAVASSFMAWGIVIATDADRDKAAARQTIHP
jgi:hypothetical protein